jgi:maltose-binding protein MalE
MRWLGLRVRIAIAIIAVAIGACWSLAVSTSEWAQNENDQQRATKVSASVEMDLDQVSAVLQRNPDAKTEDFVFAGIPAAGYLGAEGVLIPLTPGDIVDD